MSNPTHNNNELHVIFGTGPVGLAIMTELRQRGIQVRMINRSGKASVPAEVQVLKGDATDLQKAIKCAEGASVIYHAMNVPYPQWFDLFPKFNKAMIAAAEATSAKLIVMENLYMYDAYTANPMTEDSPYATHTKKGKLRGELARELLEAHQQGRIKLVIGRASDFFGPGVEDSSMGGSRVISPAINGKGAQIVGNPDKLHTYSYVPDVGRALVTLALHDKALGKVWHLPVADTISTRALIEKIFAATGHTPKISSAPKLAIRALGLFNPMMRELVEMIYEFEIDFVMDSSRFKQTFGDISTPLDQAVAETVASFKATADQAA